MLVARETKAKLCDVIGFWMGLRQAMNELPGKPYGMRPSVARDVLGNGLAAVLSVVLQRPELASPIRDRLKNPEAREVTRATVCAALKRKLVTDERFAIEFARFNPSGTALIPSQEG